MKRWTLHLVFGSRVKFLGSADRTTLLLVGRNQDGGRRPFWKLQVVIISATDDLIHFT